MQRPAAGADPEGLRKATEWDNTGTRNFKRVFLVLWMVLKASVIETVPHPSNMIPGCYFVSWIMSFSVQSWSHYPNTFCLLLWCAISFQWFNTGDSTKNFHLWYFQLQLRAKCSRFEPEYFAAPEPEIRAHSNSYSGIVILNMLIQNWPFSCIYQSSHSQEHHSKSSEHKLWKLQNQPLFHVSVCTLTASSRVRRTVGLNAVM